MPAFSASMRMTDDHAAEPPEIRSVAEICVDEISRCSGRKKLAYFPLRRRGRIIRDVISASKFESKNTNNAKSAVAARRACQSAHHSVPSAIETAVTIATKNR